MEPFRQSWVGNETPSYGTNLPAAPPTTNESDSKLEITVIFTSADATAAAIDWTGALLNGLNGRISLVAAQSVPYPLPLESPAALLDFNKRRLINIASASPVETTVHLYLCRWRSETLASVLKPSSVVVIGGRERWWPTWEKSMARKLQAAGFTVIFLITPEARRVIHSCRATSGQWDHKKDS
jgi:hypothetical protein